MSKFQRRLFAMFALDIGIRTHYIQFIVLHSAVPILRLIYYNNVFGRVPTS